MSFASGSKPAGQATAVVNVPEMAELVLSYETVVFGSLSGTSARAVGIRFFVSLRRSFADALEAIFLDLFRCRRLIGFLGMGDH